MGFFAHVEFFRPNYVPTHQSSLERIATSAKNDTDLASATVINITTTYFQAEEKTEDGCGLNRKENRSRSRRKN